MHSLRLLCLAFLPLALGAASAGPDEPRPVPVSQALVQLNREARDAWDRDGDWPSLRSDFAQRRRLRVGNDELLRVLGRRLNADRALEGYVKWELLSFGPDLTKASPDMLRRMIAVMPELTRTPEPTIPPLSVPLSRRHNRGDPAGGHYIMVPAPVKEARPEPPRSGAAAPGAPARAPAPEASEPPVDERLVAEAIARAESDWAEPRRRAAAACAPALAFRESFIAMLPASDGLRLEAMIKDLRDRVEAGHPTYAAAVDRLVAECAKLPIDPNDPGGLAGSKTAATRPGREGARGPSTSAAGVSARMRLALATEAETLARLETRVPLGVRRAPIDGDDPIEVKWGVVSVPPEKLDAILKSLRGTPGEDEDPVESKPFGDF